MTGLMSNEELLTSTYLIFIIILKYNIENRIVAMKLNKFIQVCNSVSIKIDSINFI